MSNISCSCTNPVITLLRRQESGATEPHIEVVEVTHQAKCPLHRRTSIGSVSSEASFLTAPGTNCKHCNEDSPELKVAFPMPAERLHDGDLPETSGALQAGEDLDGEDIPRMNGRLSVPDGSVNGNVRDIGTSRRSGIPATGTVVSKQPDSRIKHEKSNSPKCRYGERATNPTGRVMSLCDCRGTRQFVHCECLMRRILRSRAQYCEFCGQRFQIRAPAPKRPTRPRSKAVKKIYRKKGKHRMGISICSAIERLFAFRFSIEWI